MKFPSVSLLALLVTVPACTKLVMSSAGPLEGAVDHARKAPVPMPVSLAMAGALAPLADDDFDGDDDDDGSGTGDTEIADTLTEPRLAKLLAETGFPKRAIPKLVCTAKFESALNPAAQNTNVNGSQDTGLFQINDLWLEACGVTRVELLNPASNAKCALTVYKQHGITAWNGFNRQKSTCNRYRIARA